jgi:hypothetical protein
VLVSPCPPSSLDPTLSPSSPPGALALRVSVTLLHARSSPLVVLLAPPLSSRRLARSAPLVNFGLSQLSPSGMHRSGPINVCLSAEARAAFDRAIPPPFYSLPLSTSATRTSRRPQSWSSCGASAGGRLGPAYRSCAARAGASGRPVMARRRTRSTVSGGMERKGDQRGESDLVHVRLVLLEDKVDACRPLFCLQEVG